MGIFTDEPKKIKLNLFCVNTGVHIFWSVQSEKSLILKEKSTNFISEEIHCPEGKTICLVSMNTVSHPFNTQQPKWSEKYNWITSLFCLKPQWRVFPKMLAQSLLDVSVLWGNEKWISLFERPIPTLKRRRERALLQIGKLHIKIELPYSYICLANPEWAIFEVGGVLLVLKHQAFSERDGRS